MPRKFVFSLLSGFFLIFLSACNQTQNPDSGTPVSGTPASSAAPAPEPAPPGPQQLTLFIVPMNPGDFSMEKIQANKKKIEENPTDVQALIELGNANFMIQRFEVTQDMLSRAVKADPKKLEARLTLATSRVLMRDIDGALKDLDDLLKVQADYPEALYNKGLIQLQSLGDRTAAKGTWTRLVQVHPEHNLARQVQSVLGQL